MKEKCLTLIIGILIGAILTAGGFLIYNNVIKDKNANTGIQREFKGGGPNGNFSDGKMSNGKHDRNLDANSEDKNSSDSEIPTGEKPDGEPPTKPGEVTTTNENL